MSRKFTLNFGVPLLALILLTLNTIRVYANEIPVKGITTYPLIETFESGTFPPANWSMYSLMNNSQSWELDPWINHTEGGTHSAFHNQSAEFTLDNWLVSPQISMPAEGFYYLTFWSWLANNWAYKKSSVMVSTGSPNPADNDYVEVWMLTETNNAWSWYQYFVNLEAYAGQNIYVAFRYEGDPWGHTWYVDDIGLGQEIDDSPVLNVSTSEVSQGLGVNGTGSKTFNVINGGILDLNFDIAIEYLNADGWLSINPTSGSMGTHASVEISLNFDAAGLGFGIYQANLNISSNDPVNPTTTVLVTLEVIDVNVYPFIEDFESENFPPIGWSMFDSDLDGFAWYQSWYNNTPGGQFSAYHGWGQQNQDGWLVSPQITIPETGFFYLSFWSLVGDISYYGKNSVMVSTGSGNPASGAFTEVWTVGEVVDTWVQHFVNLEAFAGEDVYIAFRYEGEFAHYWIVDDISLGEEIDDSPVLNVSTLEISQTVGQDGSGSKSFKVINDGILNLTYGIDIEFLNGNSWLTASPTSGSIPAKSNQTISLAFNASGLELGVYQANINIASNDPVNPTATIVVTLNVMPAQAVNLTVVYPQYSFPTGISSNGMYVSGSQFGGMSSYLWKMFSGTIEFAGDAQKVSDSGIAAGTYDTEFQYEGLDVGTAGHWNRTTNQWQFLGMNPQVPEIFGSSYNMAYGITADGITTVGMQWYPDWSVKAYSWTQANGYDMIGSTIQANSRANGISANGSVIYGWAEPNWTRTPV
ncbi:MAG: choice-of-anchor J domain-containing protein, partial [Bacteroidetes bacterium]|nr:choice-of-anchor J domain-containing protein [Bacteroidota bacterium]